MIALPQDQKSYLSLPKEEIEELEALFTLAEQKIKAIEHNGEGLDVPSINELRYVGRHLLTALKSQNPNELSKARNHAKRALYDACEVQIVANLTLIESFQTDYRLLAVSDVVKEYVTLMAKAEKARDFIQETESNSREDYYKECDEKVNALKEINKILNSARPDLNVKLEDKRISTQRWVAGTVIMVIGIIATALVKIFAK